MNYIMKRVLDKASLIINEVTKVMHDMLWGTIIIVTIGLTVMSIYMFVENLLA